MLTIRRLIISTLLCLSSVELIAEEIKYDTPPAVNSMTNTSELSYEELYAIFTLTMQRWRNGEKIRVVLMSDNKFAHKFFLENYLGIGRAAYNRRLENAVASGRGIAPIVVDGNLDMIKKLRSMAGAIGYFDGTVYVSQVKDESIILIKVK